MDPIKQPDGDPNNPNRVDDVPHSPPDMPDITPDSLPEELPSHHGEDEKGGL